MKRSAASSRAMRRLAWVIGRFRRRAPAALLGALPISLVLAPMALAAGLLVEANRAIGEARGATPEVFVTSPQAPSPDRCDARRTGPEPQISLDLDVYPLHSPGSPK